MGDLPGEGGAGAAKPAEPHSPPLPEPNVSEIGVENWAAADKAACEIIRKIQPTHVSEERRRDVVDYIQRLMRDCLRVEVFPYGSVPLKTYLPDGDIDLTAFGGGSSNNEDMLVNEMKSLLEEEERNASAKFVVKDVQLIRAEVKIVKCIVQDIVVDISFNQIGGLCTLCFLEQVDRLIGRDHLFKCSIILIKAWCYYESRILGAHHGLISTYALETLVMYIFHLYSSTLDGPLMVLYKFLDCFSKFDWETYCISLQGPARISSLPTIDVEIPEDSDKVLLLSNDFLNSCVDAFSVPSRDGSFQTKHLNIVDPLKEVNNLGRSVSRGNYYRIRSAFSYGARKLARILQQPPASIANELEKFFANTMARHGGGHRPDARGFDRLLLNNMHVSKAPFPEAGIYSADNSYECFDRTDDATAPVLDCFGISGRHDNLFEADHGRASRNGSAELLDSSDLTGDYESYVHHLQYGRWCYEYDVAMPPQPQSQPLPVSTYQWEGLLPMLHYKQNGFSQHHHNSYMPNPVIYGMHHSVVLPGIPFAWEEVQKHRGTGTYLPNTNVPRHAMRSPAMKVRIQAPSRSPRHNLAMTTQEAYMLDSSSHERAQPVHYQLTPPPHQNDMEVEPVLQRSVSSLPRSSGSNLQRPQTAPSKEQEGMSLRSSYVLKDEDDFPPLMAGER